MRIFTPQSGQSLVELLCAIAVFTIGVVVIGYLILDAQVALSQHIRYTEAALLEKEGIEVARILRDDGFENLTPGTHGIQLSDDRWTLTASPIVQDIFTRTLTVTDIDEQTKKVESTVEWDISSARAGRVTEYAYLTDWKQTLGSAGDVSITTDEVYLVASSTALGGITLENNSETVHVLTAMTVQWTGRQTLDFISFGGETVFEAPFSSGMLSDSFIDTVDFVLNPHEVATLDVLGFSDAVEQTDFIITFYFEDGSKKNVLISV